MTLSKEREMRFFRLIFCLCFLSLGFAQIVYVIDKKDPEFEAICDWNIYTLGNPYNGDCVYKRKMMVPAMGGGRKP